MPTPLPRTASDPVRPRLPGFSRLSPDPGRLRTETASAWAVFGIRASGHSYYTLAAAFELHCGQGSLFRLGRGGEILTPAKDPQHGLLLAHKVREDLGDAVWISVAWRIREELASGVREAGDVLRVVCALKRTPGVYQLDDVAVECAVARSPEVTRHLAELIEPVVTQPDLLKTLEALIAADGNRARAASELIIHRSTIDYRLRRIEHLTGHSPTQVRGLQTLCTALAVRALALPTLQPALNGGDDEPALMACRSASDARADIAPMPATPGHRPPAGVLDSERCCEPALMVLRSQPSCLVT